jgi:putative glutamine transport system permease protein
MDFLNAYDLSNLLFLWRGLITTLELSIITIVISVVLGVLLGFLRFTGISVIAHLIGMYIQAARNLPPLLLIFFAFFALPDIGIKLDPKLAVIVALSAYGSALIAEVVRGGLHSIENGQMEAARSQGFSYIQTIRYIFFPQAFRRMIPTLTGVFITLIKDTSLAVIISLEELTKAAQIIYSSDVQYVIPILLLIALIYFFINYGLSLISRKLEKILSI